MRKFTLLSLFICTMAASFGQVLPTASDVAVKQQPMTDSGSLKNSLKGGGDIIWQETFDWADPTSPQGWKMPEGWSSTDLSDLGNTWIWKKDTLGANLVKVVPPSWFASKSDGYLCLPLDEYNYRDKIATKNVANAYVETPKIDCSKAASVVVKFNQYWRYCCTNYNLEMMVTNDEGVHWATYDVKYGTAGNVFTPERYRSLEINISDVAAGLSTVQIRFYMHGPYEYFWMIDDLVLAEAYSNDLVMEDTWINFDNGAGTSIGQINTWPLSQMGMAGTTGAVGNYSFKAAFLNNGVNDSENAKLNLEILKNGSQILNEQAAANTIWALDRDTQDIPNPWLANDYGDYQFNLSGVTDNGDDVPANNKTAYRFSVNDTMLFRSDFTVESSGNSTLWSGGSGAGNMIATPYTLFEPAELNSITAYFDSYEVNENPQFQFVLIKLIGDDRQELAVTDVLDMDSTYVGKYVTLPVTKDGESEFLQPGSYYACVRMWGTMPTTGAGSSGIDVGRDLSTKFGGCPIYFTIGGKWSNVSGNPLWMIGFNLNKTGGPVQAPVTFNVNMTKHIASGQFVPGTDVVAVNGLAASWNGVVTMTDQDGDGIYTANVEGLKVNNELQYKYSINGTVEDYPTTGNPYRSYTVRYWNVINNTYNGGVTTGVDTKSLYASFNVFPNPTSGAFTVEISNVTASDLVITLTNIQGQTIYQNNVKNVVNYQENIGNQLSRGLYFLTVNNGKEVKVQKVVVQ